MPWLETDNAYFESIYNDFESPLNIKQPPDYTAADHARDLNKLNGLIVQGMHELESTVVGRFGLRASKLNLWSPFTYPYVNYGIFALFVQLFFMYCTAPYLEDRWGRRFFTGFVPASRSSESVRW